jgi:hypothetical protein
VAIPNQKLLLRGLLRILTPDEIEDLSRIYLSLFRKSLTGLIDEKINLDKKERGLDRTFSPPPLSKIRRVNKKVRTLPPLLNSKPTGGVIFYLDEKEKFKDLSRRQKKLGSTYQKTSRLSGKASKGILINKRCA